MGSRGTGTVALMSRSDELTEELRAASDTSDVAEESLEEAKRYIDQVEYDPARKYKEWDDTAAGGWSYDKDGKTGREQAAFFKEHSNVDELIRDMNSDDIWAFRHMWTPGRFMDGQQYRGFDSMSPEEQRATRIFDKYLDRATLDRDIVVTRRATAELVMGAGKKTATLEELRAMRGSLVTSKGSMSTGAAKEGLTIGGSKSVEYKIHIAAGTKGAGMWVGDSRINGWGPEQREYMTNRDSVYAVGRTTYDKSRHVYIVNMYYVGREPHDYGKAGK